MPPAVCKTTRKRTYLDPVHQEIVLDRHNVAQNLVIQLIDTAEFQRLRRIHQMGVACFTYQGAEGSRFTHSVGVMHVARNLTRLLAEQYPAIVQYEPLILASALLHDVGHGPYSHESEKILGYDHEQWSCEIIEGDTEVNQVLRAYDDSMPGAITAVLRKKYTPRFITDLISSQMDCDRFDYLLRDSYMTGTSYGHFALHRILGSIEIDELGDRLIVAGDKGKTAVEDYLFARCSMYQQVYYHRKNLAARALLSRLIRRSCYLGSQLIFVDEITKKWLASEKLSVKEYLFLDDVQMGYNIKRWSEDPDPIMADLAKRFLNRRLFNASKLPRLDQGQLDELKAAVRAVLIEQGFDPEYYLSVETSDIRPYDYYRPDVKNPQRNIMVRTERGEICELSAISPTVEALVRGFFDSHWLIYPSEVKGKVAEIVERTCYNA